MNLLHCDPQGNFLVNEDVAKHLQQFAAFHVACMLGTERAGKSTLGSWLSDYTQFPSQTGNLGFTKAVWVAIKPSGDNVLYLDFEGFSGSSLHNTRLFVLAVLLSHIVIFNSPKQITMDYLDKLQSASCLSRDLASCGHRPALLWLLRDYDLDHNQDQLDYLLRWMSLHPEIGQAIRALVPNHACLSLPPPLPDSIQPGAAVPLSMAQAVLAVRGKIGQLLLTGPQISGLEFVALLRTMCSAVNLSGEHLDVSTAWQARVKAEARDRKVKRQLEITDVCRNDLQDLSPTVWERNVRTLFTPDERAEFEELFAHERDLTERAWAKKTRTVTDKLSLLLDNCHNLETLSGFFRDVLHKYEPREMVDMAVAALLPDIAKKIMSADVETKQQCAELAAECHSLAERTQTLESHLNERLLQNRQARDELQANLAAHHAVEIGVRDAELRQETSRAVCLEASLKERNDQLGHRLTELFATQQRLEDEQAEKAQLAHRLEESGQEHQNLKRRLEETETRTENQSKKLRDSLGAELSSARITVEALQDRLRGLEDQLEQSLHEKDVLIRRVGEVEEQRQAQQERAIRLQSELMRTPALGVSDLTLRAQVDALTAQNSRLRNRVFAH